MKKTDAIKHFGSQAAIARALQISKTAVSNWPEAIPPRRAYELERLTEGELKTDLLVVRQSTEQHKKDNAA
ncbi:Cro/CI family transcriptional regulator [Aliidiomarina sp. Khilg15.8]